MAEATATSGAETAAPPAAAAPAAAGRRVQPHDFRQPAFLSEGELRRLRTRHEDFARFLAARLSLYLRMECGLKLAELTTPAYARFLEALPAPSHLSLFRIEPLAGTGLLAFSPRVALAIADRLLGGRGRAGEIDRTLTEIEIALIEDVVLLVLEEWCGLWPADPALRPAVIGHESDGRFLQTSPRDAVIFRCALEASFGGATALLQLGIPYGMIEPVWKRLPARAPEAAAARTAGRPAAWHAAFDRVDVPVRAEWQALEIPLRELASLRPGDVLELPSALFSDTRVLLNGAPRFVGTVGLNADRVAVQLTRKLPVEDSLYAQSDGRKDP